jgi:hypothetical protein
VKHVRRAAIICLALALAGCGPATGNSATGNSATGNTATGNTASGNTATGNTATKSTHSVTGSSTADPTRNEAGATAAAHTGPDGPAGFWYGSDSWPIPVTGSATGDTPYKNPAIGGGYGGYVGMAGNWARWQGCGSGNFLAWSSTNSEQANTNYARYGAGIGTAVYWYMGGPGVDPDWNGTAAEASAWGARQAAQAISAANRDDVTYPILFMDIEMPGINPAPDNGWTEVYTSPCSGEPKSGQLVTSALARAEFNGFADYLTANSSYRAGVYSDAVTWTQIFGSAGYIPHTYEWTYEPETASLSDAPQGWCLKDGSACAEFFGGVTSSSPYAVMWQWSGGGGVRNALGDFDQIDTKTVR